MEYKMKVSLITTLYNEANNILRFLESYKKQTRYADEFIIVDGGSKDETITILKDFIEKNSVLNIRLIIDKTCSKEFSSGPIAKGRNIAIENAQFDIIAVTDAGCLLKPYWLEEITKPFQKDEIDVVAGWYEANITNDFQKIYAELFMPNLQNLNIEQFLPSSRSIAFKKECWKKVKHYPIESLTAEDTLFDVNLKKKGCRFYFASKALVLWDCPANYFEAVDKAEYYAKGDGKYKIFFIKFFLRNIFLIFPINILLSSKRRKNFFLAYRVMLSYQIGYLKGLFQ